MKSILLITALLVAFSNPIQAQVAETESGMKWYSFEEAHSKAKEEGKMILIFGHADWCPYCRKMRNEVYSDSTVREVIYKHFYPIQLDSESEQMVNFNGSEVEEYKLAAYLRLQSLPTHYFMDENWVTLGAQPGFIPAEVFKPMLEYVGTGSYTSMEFDEFLNASE